MTANERENRLELCVTRYIAAPPERVWQIMTERQAEWWCPRPWTVEIVEQQWRAGGRTAMVMRGPEGEEIPQEGIFLEVTPLERFVTTDALDSNWQPREAFMVGIWEIAPERAGTRYRACARHWTAEAMRQHEEMGFREGWRICAEQLAALAEGV